MAKTNVRPFYLPENGKPFHEEIKGAKRPRGPHKIASRAKCGPRATGWAALEYSLSKAHEGWAFQNTWLFQNYSE